MSSLNNNDVKIIQMVFGDSYLEKLSNGRKEKYTALKELISTTIEYKFKYSKIEDKNSAILNMKNLKKMEIMKINSKFSKLESMYLKLKSEITSGLKDLIFKLNLGLIEDDLSDLLRIKDFHPFFSKIVQKIMEEDFTNDDCASLFKEIF